MPGARRRRRGWDVPGRVPLRRRCWRAEAHDIRGSRAPARDANARHDCCVPSPRAPRDSHALEREPPRSDGRRHATPHGARARLRETQEVTLDSADLASVKAVIASDAMLWGAALSAPAEPNPAYQEHWRSLAQGFAHGLPCGPATPTTTATSSPPLICTSSASTSDPSEELLAVARGREVTKLPSDTTARFEFQVFYQPRRAPLALEVRASLPYVARHAARRRLHPELAGLPHARRRPRLRCRSLGSMSQTSPTPHRCRFLERSPRGGVA